VVQQYSRIFYYVYGNTLDNLTYATDWYNFTVGQDIGSTSINSPYLGNANYTDAIVIIPIDSIGYPAGLGLECGVNASGAFSGYAPANQQYYVETLGVTSAAWVYILGSGIIGQNINISCISLSNLYQNETHATYYIDSLPKIYNLLIPNAESCTSYILGANKGTCEATMRSLNISAWYCDYDADQCLETNPITGACSKYGVYTGYSCSSCSLIPQGFTCNASSYIGQQVNGSTDVNEQIGSSIGSIFKINSASALAFLSCILFAIIGIALGAYIKNGTVIIIGVLSGMLGMFFLGWIPIYIPIVLAIIAAFLISKWITSATQGQGG
jgi:hypothetical protein